MEQRQNEQLQHGSSARYQPPPEVENANPSKGCEPSVPASFTITNSESEITPGGNPPPPQFKTVENRSNLHYSSDHRQKFYNHLSDQYGYFSILPISPTESEAT